MNKIKWIGPKHYPAFGVCIPGQIVTEEQIGFDIMEKWVGQGFAEWHSGQDDKPVKPVGEVIKKHKIKREV